MPKYAGEDRIMGRCSDCHRRLLVDKNSGLCVMCENKMLRAKIEVLEFQLCRREVKSQSKYQGGEK